MTKTEHYDLLSVGRAAVDLYGVEIGTRLEDVQSFKKSLGGSPANVAIGSARLGLQSAMLSRVGHEQMGNFVRETFVQEGVDVTNLQTDRDRLTALVLLSIRDRHTFPLIFYRENCADMAIDLAAIDEAHVARARTVHVTGTHFSTPAMDAVSRRVIAIAKQSGARVVFDIDYRPVLWGLTGHRSGEERYVASDRVSAHLETVLPDCDLIVGTEEEIRIAGGDDVIHRALVEIRAQSTATIVMKRGPLGCVVYEGAIPDDLEAGLVLAGESVDVLNVLGAGDAFLAGFLSGWIPGEPIATCCRRANAAGAIVVSRHACAPAMPTHEELETYLDAADVGQRERLDRTERVHHTSTRRTVPSPLWVMAFDHRTQLEAVTNDRAKLIALKSRIGDAALLAKETLGAASIGIIVDERYGAEVLSRFSQQPSWWVARPIEASGPKLSLIGAPNVGLALTTWPARQVVKCLVRDPVDDTPTRRAQDEQIVMLARACTKLGRSLMLEMLPMNASGELVEEAAPVALSRLYQLGVSPELWKLSLPADPQVWRAVDEVVNHFDADCQGVLLLGNGRPLDALVARMQAGRDFAVCRGFAVGRTVFFEPAVEWIEGGIDDQTLVRRVADNFVQLVRSLDAGGAPR